MTTETAQLPFREETAEVWGGKLTLRVKVAGTGPALLYLHGSMGLVWDPFLSRLAENHTVYAPEFPGTSPADVDAVHTIDQLSDIVLAHEELVRKLIADGPLVGTPEQVVEALVDLQSRGMTYAITYFVEQAYDLSGVELFEQAVIPAFIEREHHSNMWHFMHGR